MIANPIIYICNGHGIVFKPLNNYQWHENFHKRSIKKEKKKKEAQLKHVLKLKNSPLNKILGGEWVDIYIYIHFFQENSCKISNLYLHALGHLHPLYLGGHRVIEVDLHFPPQD
jgi:hypothetical protein